MSTREAIRLHSFCVELARLTHAALLAPLSLMADVTGCEWVSYLVTQLLNVVGLSPTKIHTRGLEGSGNDVGSPTPRRGVSFRTSKSADLAVLLAPSFVDRMPNPMNISPLGAVANCTGGTGGSFHRASRSMPSNSLAAQTVSKFTGNTTISAFWPAKAESFEEIIPRSLKAKSRIAPCCSRFTRARCSASASLLSCAASFSFLEARSLAFPALFSASPAFWRASPASLFNAAIFSSDICCSWSAARDALPPNLYSPYTPPAMRRVHAKASHVSDLGLSLLNRKITKISPRSPMNTPIVANSDQLRFLANTSLSASPDSSVMNYRCSELEHPKTGWSIRCAMRQSTCSFFDHKRSGKRPYPCTC